MAGAEIMCIFLQGGKHGDSSFKKFQASTSDNEYWKGLIQRFYTKNEIKTPGKQGSFLLPSVYFVWFSNHNIIKIGSDYYRADHKMLF